MVDRDIRKLTPGEADELGADVLHDTETGELYEISEEYYKRIMNQRVTSTEHEQDLQLARELLQSKLRQLTKRQKDVMYYKMQNMTEEQIGKKMGISHQTVAEHLEAATKKLAKLIKTTKEVINNDSDRNDNETDIRS